MVARCTETFTHRKEAVVPADLVERHGINYSQEPSVVVKDDRLELYFVSIGLTLGRAISKRTAAE